MTITAGTWFPVITLLLGFATKSVADWFQDSRIAKREALIRRENRRDEARIRQLEFQRSNLLELQESAARFIKTLGSAHYHDVKTCRESGTWSRSLLPDDLNENLYQNQTRTKLLAERVADEAARLLGRGLLAAGVTVTMAQSEAESDQAVMEAGQKIDALNQRIGELLRAIDETE